MSDKVDIRPSGVAAFFDCSYRWYRDTLYKPIRSVGMAAHFGTGVHKAAEEYYTECMKETKWVDVRDDFKGVAIDALRNRIKDDEPNDLKDFDLNKLEKDVASIAVNYLNKSKKLQKEDIPEDVEKSYTVQVNSSKIKSVRGTLDIVGKNYIVDIKTMSRWNPPQNYIVQQGIYAWLRKKSNEDVQDLRIHRVNTKTSEIDSKSILQSLENPFISIDSIIQTSEEYLRTIIKSVDLFNKTGDEVIFRGNPKSLICSSKYCPYWNECKWRSIK